MIELIHGQPGQPQDWITVVGVTHAFGHLLAKKLAPPAVLVMPDANGGRNISLQCLDQAGGPQDLTYLAVDLPAQIARILRVLPPGIGLGRGRLLRGRVLRRQHGPALPPPVRVRRGAQRLFQPYDNQLANGPRGQPIRRQQQAARTEHPAGADPASCPPLRSSPGSGSVPGPDDRQDVANAKRFWQELRLRQAYCRCTLTPGGGHTMATWRAQVPSMLTWMTPAWPGRPRNQAATVAHAGADDTLAPVSTQPASSRA